VSEAPPPAETAAPAPSGTVVVLRDAARLELLLLQRVAREGKPGPWVFPGGKVETPDRRPGADPADDALRAAVREAREEAGLALAPDALAPISRWITPSLSPKRFDAWFFVTAADADAPVTVDGAEIGAHRWLAPADALAAHHAGEIRLAPPTFVTVTWLVGFRAAPEAVRTLPERQPTPFHPRIHRVEDGACMLYPGDAGYERGEIEAPGARHRLWALAAGWRYERRGV